MATAADELRLTRSGLIALGGAACASLGMRVPWAAAAQGGADEAYVSRPDLKPPTVTIGVPADATAPGYVFLAPFEISVASSATYRTPRNESHSGPLVVDDGGEPVWFLPFSSKTAMDFRIQVYRGRRVLTWYEGTVLGAYGGDYVIYDLTYHEVARVKAGRGRHGDLHEFLLTPKGTALITIYEEIRADLTSVGGSADARLVTGIVQEVDVATGRVVFEWRSHDHVGVDESYMTQVTSQGNVDYFHLNSVDVDSDGNLLVSARHTSAVYKVDRRSGAVIWRLGGMKSDFAVDPAASFRFQHDVRRQPDGTITIFDNNSAAPGTAASSRGLRIALDEGAMRASFVQEWVTPDPRFGWAMGNVQVLSDGGVFVCWGTDGSFSEFGPDGELRYDARFADGSITYRAFRFELDAHPTGRPSAALAQSSDGTSTLYASWNGATQVARWQLQAGPRPDRLSTVVTVPRNGFETGIAVPTTRAYAAAAAVDASGRHLGTTLPLAV